MGRRNRQRRTRRTRQAAQPLPRGSAPRPRAKLHPIEPALAMAVAVTALLGTVPRLCPTLALMGDSAVFVTAAAELGVPQPPGYPLYTLLGHVATWLPFGELPWRVHLTSALYHAATAGVVAALVQKLTGSRIAAVGGALFLAFARAFLLGSLYAEVFPLNDLFTALLLLLALRFYERSEVDADASRALDGLVLGIGVASAHHQMIALLAPALLVFALRGNAKLLLDRRRLPLRVALFLGPVLGFDLLILVWARASPIGNWGDVNSLAGLWQLVTRQDYGGMFSPFLGERASQSSELVGAYTKSLYQSMGIVGLGLAVVGAWRIERTASSALFLAWLTAGPIFAVLNAVPVDNEGGLAFAERFMTMSLVPLGVLAGGGVAALERGIVLVFTRRAGPAAGLVALLPLVANADVDLASDRRGMQFARDLFSKPEDGALVLITGDSLNGAALYWCGVEQRCGTRAIFSPGQTHLGWRLKQLKRRHPDVRFPDPEGKFITVRELVAANLGRRPVYLSPMLLEREPALRSAFSYLPHWLLLRVVEPHELEAQGAHFIQRAQQLARLDGCAGCRMVSEDLLRPSLEATIVQHYVDAFVNHARVLRAYYRDSELAALLERRALTIDRKRASGYL